MGAPYEKGRFVDCNGKDRDVANPGYGMGCKVEGNTVLPLGEYDPEDGSEVLEECTFYPTLDALSAISFRPEERGKEVSI